jgi:hypothetical protein
VYHTYTGVKTRGFARVYGWEMEKYKKGVFELYDQPKRYGFRWRVFYHEDGKWDEPWRIRLGETLFLLRFLINHTALTHGNHRRVYVALPWIVDVSNHNW